MTFSKRILRARQFQLTAATVVRLSKEGRLGLFISRGIGVFPRYVGSIHRLLDATNGQLLYSYRDPFYPAGAPLAVDLNGDGVDEPFFFSVRFPSARGARIHVLHLPSRQLVTHEVETNYWTTPVIADARGNGQLELIGLSWSQRETTEVPNWRDLEWQLLRMDLNASVPAVLTWAGYMGSRHDGVYVQR